MPTLPDGLETPTLPEGLEKLPPPPPPEGLALETLLPPPPPDEWPPPPPELPRWALAEKAINRHKSVPEAVKSKFLYVIFMILND